MKICTRCFNKKSDDNFAKHAKYADGLLSWCKSCVSENKKLWRSKNKEHVLETNREYLKSAKRKEWRKTYRKNKAKTDPAYLLSERVRNRIKCWVRDAKGLKHSNSAELTGISWDGLRKYLESKFEPWMSWENYGEWHIDHIKPLSAFDIVDPEQMKTACYYTNLQPLRASDNLKKSNKY